jgi:hypothetical protein
VKLTALFFLYLVILEVVTAATVHPFMAILLCNSYGSTPFILFFLLFIKRIWTAASNPTLPVLEGLSRSLCKGVCECMSDGLIGDSMTQTHHSVRCCIQSQMLCFDRDCPLKVINVVVFALHDNGCLIAAQWLQCGDGCGNITVALQSDK